MDDDQLDVFPEFVPTAPVAAALLLGHDDEAPTMRFDRREVLEELRRQDEAALKAQLGADDPLGFRECQTLDTFRDLVGRSRRTQSQTPTLPAPPPLPAASARLTDAAPLRLVRRKSSWMDKLPSGTRAVLEDAASLTPSWPLQARVVGAVAIPKQRIPSLRSVARPSLHASTP